MRRLVWMALCAAATACAAPVPGTASPRQVIIGFDATTDTAAPATLASLARTSQVAVSFVAAISPRSAAYRLDCPPADPACEKAIAALRAHPAVRYLEPDRMKDSR
ncbi:MAG: hypothetical protein L6Q69_21505 [Zoogloea sp.]|nr:hypothetical protein [Zoogloea sp.]